MAHIVKVNFDGDPNVGLYGVVTDKFCLIGAGVKTKYIKQLREVLNVPVLPVKLYGTSLIGVFAVATSKVILVPDIVFDDELKQLKSALKKAKLSVTVNILDTEHTALGNNILTNDEIGFVSSCYSTKEFTEIKNLLNIKKLYKFDVPQLNVPGSLGVLTNKGGIFSPSLTDAQVAKLEESIGHELGIGSVNQGNPFVKAGLLANSNGFAVGAMSTGFEMARIDESLGLL